MKPAQLLAHLDSGQLWPAGGGDAFTDIASAYQTALAVRALRVTRGEQPRGYKIGFTNRSIWPRYQVFAPIWGTVWDTTLAFARPVAQPVARSSAHDSHTVSLAHTCQPRIEPELVFAFKQTPPPACSLDQLFDALDWLAPGFEVVQSHQPDWKFTPAQTVADSGLHARLWVGDAVPVNAVAASAAALHLLLAGAQAHLSQGTTAVDQGHGALVLGSPLHALQHFLTELRACPGATDVAPGDVVTTGTWTDAWPVAAGQDWSVRFSKGLSGLRVSFV
jgi:2-oxo-3-hexenedioate decarboxylase